MILLLGIGKSILKQFYVDNCTCSHCTQTLQHRFTVYGHYFSFFFVPVVPLFKTTTSECVHCRKELEKDRWNPNLKEKFDRAIALQPPKRPWWHFLGCLGFLFIVLFFSMLSGYAYYKMQNDPEWQEVNKEIEAANQQEVYLYEETDSLSVEVMESTEAEEPIDSITSFFKN